MKSWIVLPCILLLAAAVAAQTDSSAPETSAQTDSSVPAETAQPVSPAEPAVVQEAVPPATIVQPGFPVPAGTALMVRLDTTLATFSNRVGDLFQGRITQPVVVNGATVIPVGSTVEGRVTTVSEPRRISGRPTIGILPEAVVLPSGERFSLDATLTDTNIRGTDVNQEGQFKGLSYDHRDKIEAGGGTAGGMLIGGLIGGGPGVLIGGAIGAGSATAHWLAQHRSATLPAGTQLTLELNRPLRMTASAVNGGSK